MFDIVCKPEEEFDIPKPKEEQTSSEEQEAASSSSSEEGEKSEL